MTTKESREQREWKLTQLREEIQRGLDDIAAGRTVEGRIVELKEKTRDLRELALALETAVGEFCVGLMRQPYHVERLLPGH